MWVGEVRVGREGGKECGGERSESGEGGREERSVGVREVRGREGEGRRVGSERKSTHQRV